MLNTKAKRGLPREMKRRQVQNPEAEHTEGTTIPEPSSLAVLYLPRLTRLLELSSDLDELLPDCGQLNPAAWKKTVVRAGNVLRIETEGLRLVDRGVQAFLLCRGGQRKLVIEANRKMKEKAAEGRNLEAARKMVGAQMAFLALNRCVAFGIDMSPFNLSDEEEAAVTKYFGDSTDQAEPGRSEELESTHRSWAVIPSDAPAAALTRVLSEPEPDVIALQGALEAVSHYLLCRIAHLSGELRRCHGQKKEERQNRENVVRIRVALVLESKRAQLVGRAIAGIFRCFGGQQRLLLESAWRQHEGPENWIKDPRVKKIVERISEELVAKVAQRDQ